MQIAKVLKNALLTVAAVMCALDAKDNTNYVATRVSCKKLKKLYSYRGLLIYKDYKYFNML